MSKKLVKKLKRKCTHKNPTLKQKFIESEKIRLELKEELGNSREDSRHLRTELDRLEKQLFHTNQIIEAQNLEMSILKETNINLHEVINVLGRRERMATQDRIFDAYSKTMNQTENTVKSDCCGFKDPD